MLANVLGALGLVVGLAALADLLLSDKQKAKIQLATIRVWSWLDYLKQLSFVNWLREYAALFLSQMASILSASFIARGTAATFGSPTYGFFAFVLSGTVLYTIGPRLMSRLLGGTNWRVTFRALLIVVIVSALQLVLLIVVAMAKETVEPGSTQDILIFLFVAIAGGISSFLLIFASVILVPWLFAYVFSTIIWVLELLFRRIAEFPKGPILGLSALCAGVAALLKVFAD